MAARGVTARQRAGRIRHAAIVAALTGLAVAAMGGTARAGSGPTMRAVSPPTAVALTAADGVRIDGLLYRAAAPRATVLLFHQAGSSKGEYATIAPRLVAAGYDALAIDQRAGGTLFGPNATVARLGRSAGYGEARRDLEAALAWGTRRGRPVVLWGSSYAAALVFEVAAAHPAQEAAVLAFSPGEYLTRPGQVRAAAAKVRAPVYVTSASGRAEVDAARAILAASPSHLKVQQVPTRGVHGSSTLIEARNPAGAEANWASVRSFLRRVTPR